MHALTHPFPTGRSADLGQAGWVEVRAAEAAVPVADERLAVAQRLEREVARRVGRALDPLFADERARTAVAPARIARDQAVEKARIARASLAGWWGRGPDFRTDARMGRGSGGEEGVSQCRSGVV